MYDVMSTTIYPEVSKRMAMKIDGEYAFKWITRGKFLRMAEKLGFSRKTMAKEIDRMSARVSSQAPALERRLGKNYPSACYAMICSGISSRIAQIAR